MRTPEEVARAAERAPRVEPTCPTRLHPTALDETLPCPECDIIHGARVIAAHVKEAVAATRDGAAAQETPSRASQEDDEPSGAKRKAIMKEMERRNTQWRLRGLPEDH